MKLSEVDKVLVEDIKALFAEFGPLGVKQAVEMLWEEERKKSEGLLPQEFWALFRFAYGKQVVPYRMRFGTLEEATTFLAEDKEASGGAVGVIMPTGRLRWSDRESTEVEGKALNHGLMEHFQEITVIPKYQPKWSKGLYATTAEKAAAAPAAPAELPVATQ